MLAREVIRWLKTLPADDAVYIDENGLTLLSESDEEAYLEVGGEPGLKYDEGEEE